MKNLHKEFIRLGREKNRITYKLLALLPKIEKQKIYQHEGYANIYDYATRIAGLSSGVVMKALKLEEKLQDLPHLQKAVETQGINKVGIVVGLATKENEKELAEKVTYMSKPALQEYSKEVRGHITANWQIELDEEMMFLFLKLKKKLGKNLSNKECLRKMLEQMTGAEKIPGDFSTTSNKQPIASQKPTRYIPVHKKRHLSPHCAYQNCHRPADTIHHPNRFAIIPSHESLQPLCKQHHEFAHNGISEPMHQTDYQYREYRQASLLL